MANDLIRIRRDTFANWESADPVLALGEISYDLTNAEIRVGDGSTSWLSLPTVGTANLADGNKGDVVVSSGGTVWSLSSSITDDLNSKLEADDLNLGTSATPSSTALQIRRGSTASWTGVLLQAGEIGFDSLLNEIRIGDGVNIWDDLDPVGLNKLQNFSIEQLGDVEVADLTVGDILVHDGTNWINQQPTYPALSLDDLTAVTLTSPTLGQILQFNGTTWVNSTFTSSGIPLGVKNDITVVDENDWQITNNSIQTSMIQNAAVNAAKIGGTGITTAGKLLLNVSSPPTGSVLVYDADELVWNPTNLGENLPVEPTDLANKTYVDTTVGLGMLTIEDQFGQPNGPALLDSTSKISTSNLATGSASSSTFLRGDRTWQTVTSGATNLDGLSDVVITSPSPNDLLYYTGTTWQQGNTDDAIASRSVVVSKLAESATAGRFPVTSLLNSTGTADPLVVYGGFIDTATVDATFEDRSIGTPTTLAKWKFDVKDASITTTKLGGDITTAGKALLDDADAAAQRTTLGLGTAATSNTTAFAAAVHTHAISDVTGLQTALDNKAATSHTHSASDITSGVFNTARLGSGTPTSEFILMGDSVWRTHNIDNLQDVSVTTPAFGQPLVFNGTVWANQTTMTLDALTFNTAPAAQSSIVGKIYYDTTKEALVTPLNGNVQVALGLAEYTKVWNNTANSIPIGNVVRITGGHAQTMLTIALANADSEINSSATIGVTAESIGINASGFVITSGLLRGINTNSLVNGVNPQEGNALWLDTVSGEMTVDRPVAPNHGVFIGWLIKKASGASGEIFVKIINGHELDEIHDVLITTPVSGQLLQFNGSVWINANLPSHTHAISDVTGLQTALDGKAATSHTHAISDVTGLQTALDGKAATSHTHSASDVTSGVFNTARLGSGTANSSTFLRGDGAWATPSAGSPAGSNTQIQFSNGTSFAADDGLTYTTATETLRIGSATTHCKIYSDANQTFIAPEGNALRIRHTTGGYITVGDATTASPNGTHILVSANDASITSNADLIWDRGPVLADYGYRVSSTAINAQTDSYTLQASDNGKIITVTAGSVKTITVPSGLNVGFNCTVLRAGSGRVVFSGSGATINSIDGLLEIGSQHGAVSLFSYATNTFNLAGNLA